MKKLITILAITTLVSCQKELTKPETPKIQTLSSTSNKPVIINDESSTPVDEIVFNQCTGEDMHITGSIKYTFHATIQDSTIHYMYETRYDNLVGIGMTTGNKYQGSGHVIDNLTGPVVFIENDPYLGDYYLATPNIESILNRAIFTTPGGSNNLTYNLTYHLHVTKDGVFVENIDWKFPHCQ